MIHLGEGFRRARRPLGGTQTAQRRVRVDRLGIVAQSVEIHDMERQFGMGLFQCPAGENRHLVDALIRQQLRQTMPADQTGRARQQDAKSCLSLRRHRCVLLQVESAI